MWQHFIHRITRFVAWHRRAVAAIAAAICVFSVTSALAPPPPAGRPVVVLTRAIAAGTTIGADDVTVKNIPTALTSDDALSDPELAIGKTTVIALSPGTHLAAGAVLGANPPPPGMRYVPVRVSDADLAKILHVGDRITLISIGADGASNTLASSVRVAALPLGQATGTLTSDTRGALLILEIPDALAPTTATASLQRSLSIIVG